jgi:SAM-dependent methyltransferase
MTSDVFGNVYASAYDALYGDKDYEAECDVLEKIFGEYADGAVGSVLDLGCGTGSHARLLSKRGYEVTGVDASREMLARAEEESDRVCGLSPTFLHGDVRTLGLGKQFDAVLMLFAVLGYQTANRDVRATLAACRQHLRPGGVLVLDVWYGPAVLATGPTERVKVVGEGEGRVLRAASAVLDTRHHLCRVDYRIWFVGSTSSLVEAEESHVMRYFFPMELEALLEDSGLELKLMSAFPTVDEPVGDSTWNALVLAT